MNNQKYKLHRIRIRMIDKPLMHCIAIATDESIKSMHEENESLESMIIRHFTTSIMKFVFKLDACVKFCTIF